MKSQKPTAWRYHDSILAAKNLYFQGPVLGPEMGSKSQTRQGAQQSMCDVCVLAIDKALNASARHVFNFKDNVGRRNAEQRALAYVMLRFVMSVCVLFPYCDSIARREAFLSMVGSSSFQRREKCLYIYVFSQKHDHTYLVPETMPIFSSKDIILMPWKGEPRSVSNLGVQKSILGSKKSPRLGVRIRPHFWIWGCVFGPKSVAIFCSKSVAISGPPFLNSKRRGHFWSQIRLHFWTPKLSIWVPKFGARTGPPEPQIWGQSWTPSVARTGPPELLFLTKNKPEA